MNDDTPLEVWSVRDAAERGKPAFWKHVGRAFRNKDGSINVLLDVLPINGKLQIRKRKAVETIVGPGRGAETPVNGPGVMQASASFPSPTY